MNEAVVVSHNPEGYENVSSYIDRHGQRRWRYRKSGEVFQLGTEYDSDEFHRRLKLARLGKRMTDRKAIKMKPAYDAIKPGSKASQQHSQGSKRRSVASVERIEAIVAMAQRRGLAVTKVTQGPDGTCEVHFENIKPVRPRGWDI